MNPTYEVDVERAEVEAKGTQKSVTSTSGPGLLDHAENVQEVCLPPQFRSSSFENYTREPPSSTAVPLPRHTWHTQTT